MLLPQAVEGGSAEALQRLLNGQDHAWGSAFSIVNLPEGEYELEIVADGYVTRRSLHTVLPGRAGTLAPITLKPLR